jgi:hypothetical protein
MSLIAHSQDGCQQGEGFPRLCPAAPQEAAAVLSNRDLHSDSRRMFALRRNDSIAKIRRVGEKHRAGLSILLAHLSPSAT